MRAERWIGTVMALALVCLLAACGEAAPVEASGEGASLPKIVYDAPVYTFPATVTREEYTAGDGTETVRYAGETPTLSVDNPDRLSPEDRARTEANSAAFAALFQDRQEAAASALRRLEEDALSLYAQDPDSFAPFYMEEHAQCTPVGELVSVRVDSTVYSGGERPSYTTQGYLFDLVSGEYTGVCALAEDPEAFRRAVGELLTAQAERQGAKDDGGREEYREILDRWDETAAVLLDGGGMTAVYSPYALSPDSPETVELRLGYLELAPLLGEAGLKRLGLDPASMEGC